jgi:hypothetical protein
MNYTLLSGSSFKEFYCGIEFIKVTNKDETEKYSYKLKDGLNEKEFRQTNGYIDGGITFVESDNMFDVFKKIWDALYIRKIEIPDDANVFIDDKEYMADKIILGERVAIIDMEQWNDKSFCDKALTIDPKLVKYCKNISSEKLKEIVSKDPYIIEHIKNPSEELINIAVERTPYLIRYIPNPPLDLLKKCIKTSPYIIRYCENLTYDVLIELVRTNPEIIDSLPNPTYELCKEAVIINPLTLKHVPINHKTEELCNMAFSANMASFPFLNKMYITKEMCIEAVKYNGEFLRQVPDRFFTDDVCIEAIKQKPRAIDIIKNPTDEMWITAIKGEPSIIFDIRNPSDEMLLLAAPKYPTLYDKIRDKNLIGDNINLDEVLKKTPSYIINIKNPTYEQWLCVIRQSGKFIKDIPQHHITEELGMIALQDYPDGLEFIDNQTDSMCLTAVFQKGVVLRFVKNQTDDISMAAVDNDPLALEYVINQTPEIVKKALDRNIKAFKFVKDKTPEIIEYACYADPDIISCINDYTSIQKYEKIITDVLKKKGLALQHIPKNLQTKEMCENALENDVYAVEYMNQDFLTEDMAIKVVKKYGYLIRHIHNKTDKINMEAIKNHPKSLSYINNQTEELCLTAVDLDYTTLLYVIKQTPEICFHAVRKHFTAMVHVNLQDEIAIKVCCVIDPRCINYVRDLTIRNECQELIKEIESYS